MKCLLFFFLSCISILADAQEKNRIYGRVLQRTTGASIPNASVFISGTSLGIMTDTAGNFELKGIPSGNFELIVSSIGYTTLVYPFSSDKLPVKLSMQMDLKVQELTEVTVEPYDPNGLQTWGRLFFDNFLGTSFAGRQCRIVNKNALRFRFNQAQGKLTVVADEPLIIENDFLGYTLQYQLEEFTYTQQEQVIFFYGYTLFKEKTANRGRTPLRFIERRQEVYNGSMAHFMKALYNDSLLQEGFEVRRLVMGINQEKERVKRIMASESRRNISSGGKTVMRLGVAPPADSATYWRQVMQQPNQVRNLGSALLRADSLLTPAEDSIKMLSFPNYLQIVFKKGLEEGSYVKDRFMGRKAGYPLSIIFLKDEEGLYIYPNGYYYPPQGVFSMEY